MRRHHHRSRGGEVADLRLRRRVERGSRVAGPLAYAHIKQMLLLVGHVLLLLRRRRVRVRRLLCLLLLLLCLLVLLLRRLVLLLVLLRRRYVLLLLLLLLWVRRRRPLVLQCVGVRWLRKDGGRRYRRSRRCVGSPGSGRGGSGTNHPGTSMRHMQAALQIVTL